VAAYCNGRDKVSEYDCLLLEHVLWQKPEHAQRIGDWLLEQLSADDSNKQVGAGGHTPQGMPAAMYSTSSMFFTRSTFWVF
jgi:hypothetical protein